MQWGGSRANKENKRCETTDDDDAAEMVTIRSERDGAIERKRSERETRESRDSWSQGEENKGKARKMCLTWQRQFFSQSCRLNARSRKAIGSREEPVGKMAAISLQPPVQVFLSPSPTYSSTRSLSSLSLFCSSRGWPTTAIPTERNPVPWNKGGRERGEKHASKTLILINCLIFPRDVRDALSRARGSCLYFVGAPT